MSSEASPRRELGVLALVLGIAAVGVSLYAVVETLPNFEYINDVINDPTQRSTEFDEPLRDSYLGTLIALFYISIVSGALALIAGLVSGVKQAFKPGFVAAALGLGALLWGPIWFFAIPDDAATSVQVTQEAYVESQRRALALLKEHQGDCDAQAQALNALASEVGQANLAFVRSVDEMEPDAQSSTKQELRQALQPIFDEADVIIGGCPNKHTLLGAYVTIVATP